MCNVFLKAKVGFSAGDCRLPMKFFICALQLQQKLSPGSAKVNFNYSQTAVFLMNAVYAPYQAMPPPTTPSRTSLSISLSLLVKLCCLHLLRFLFVRICLIKTFRQLASQSQSTVFKLRGSVAIARLCSLSHSSSLSLSLYGSLSLILWLPSYVVFIYLFA